MNEKAKRVADAAYAVAWDLTTSTDPSYATLGHPPRSKAQQLRDQADQVERQENAIWELRRALYDLDPDAYEQMRFPLRK